MAKGIGPLLLLGGLGALILARRKGDEGVGGFTLGEIVAEGTRYDGLNRPGLYRVSTVPLTKGFAFGPGNIGYLPEVKEPRGNWVSGSWMDKAFDSVEEAEAIGIGELEERGFTKDAPG